MGSENSTLSPETLLNNIYYSVQRAGPVFTGQATMQPDGAVLGSHRVTMQLVPGAFSDNEVGLRARKALGTYIRSMLRESGWRVKSASFKRGYFEFIATSRAASSLSKNA